MATTFERLRNELAHNLSRGKTQKTVRPNTIAYLQPDGDGIVLRFYTTDLLLARPDGLVEILSGDSRFTSRDRFNQFLPRGWSVFQSRGQAHLASGSGYGGFILPLERGLVAGWSVPPRILALNLQAQLGTPGAASVLADWFEEQGWLPMADSTRRLDGQRFAPFTLKHVREQLAAVEIELRYAGRDCRRHRR